MNRALEANSTLSHYRIVAKIGAGGMGEVYLAEDIRLNRKVALKVLPAELAASQDRMRRFVQEAKAASALNHPAIAHIYEIGEAEGVHFIAMEFVEGAALREKIHSDKTDLRSLLKYLAQVADGLIKAHAAGIVHRDLKPDNIMISSDGFAKILDFGLAKLIETEKPAGAANAEAVTEAATAMMPTPLSMPGMIMGTVGYMSPEQAQGKPDVDQRSDIFAFGCVLFEAATGSLPFTGDSVIDTLHKIIKAPAPPLRDFNPEAPAELQRIVRRCLQKDPEERFQSIKDVAIELKELYRDLRAADNELDYSATAPRSSQKSSISGDENATSILSAGGATANRSAAPKTDEASAIGSTSSAEYIVGEVRKHKLGVALGALMLLALLGVGIWFFSLRSSTKNAPIDSIAVLPFQNRSSDADTEYLSDGLAESLIYRLSQLPNLKVSPTSSVMRYKGKELDVKAIANDLGISAVMAGRMVQRGDNLTISVELIDARSNKLLWGEQYERKLSDLLATQREIAVEITNKLQLKLSGADEAKVAKKYTTNSEAFQLYLKGRFYWNKRNEENLRKAIEQFKAAANKDPNFALAFVGLADCYVLLPYYSSAPSNEVLPQAKANAERALEIDDSLGEAHTALGYVNRLLWNWAETEKELKRGLELNPNYPTAHKFYGNYLCDMGRNDEGMIEYKRAQELEPLSLIIYANLAEVYLAKGDLKAGVEQCQRAMDLDPNWYYARLVLALVYLKQGRGAEALAEAEKSVELSKRLSGPLGVLGYVSAQTGKRSEAEALVKELEERYTARQANGYDLARVYVGLAERDQALAWLEKDFKSRNATMPSFLYIPPLDSLRDDPRFMDLARRIGFPELQ